MHSDSTQWNNNINYPLFEPKMALTVKFGSKSSWLIELAGNSQTKSFPSGDGTAKKCDLLTALCQSRDTFIDCLLVGWRHGFSLSTWWISTEFHLKHPHHRPLSLLCKSSLWTTFFPVFAESRTVFIGWKLSNVYREISAKKTFKYVHLEMNVT